MSIKIELDSVAELDERGKKARNSNFSYFRTFPKFFPFFASDSDEYFVIFSLLLLHRRPTND